MKKQLTAVLLIFALLLTMAGCSAANAVQRLDAAEDQVEAKLDAVEDKVEMAVRNTVAPAPAVPREAPAPTEAPVQPAPEKAAPAVISKEEAEKIALDYNGFSADQVKRMWSEFEYDDGVPQYDVEYHEGDWEYEFEINAENGKILSYDKDHKYD